MLQNEPEELEEEKVEPQATVPSEELQDKIERIEVLEEHLEQERKRLFDTQKLVADLKEELVTCSEKSK